MFKNTAIFILVLICAVQAEKFSSSTAPLYKEFVQLSMEDPDNQSPAALIARIVEQSQEVEKNFQDKIVHLDDLFAGSKVALNEAKTKIAERRNTAQQAQNESKNSIADLTRHAEDLGADLASQQNVINDLNRDLKEAASNFAERVGEANRKVGIIKTLIGIVDDELINKEGNSFLQLSTSFYTNMNNLKNSLNKKTDGALTMMVTTLLELAANREYANRDTVKKIRELLVGLRDRTEQFGKDEKQSFENSNKLINNSLEAALNSQRVLSASLAQAQVDVTAAEKLSQLHEDELENLDGEEKLIDNFEGQYNDAVEKVHKTVERISEKYTEAQEALHALSDELTKA